jgi:hypothetical protein
MKRGTMKITKARLRELVQEELTQTHQSIGASRTIEEVLTSANESLIQAHKDLQMLSLHLKNAGSTTEEVEGLIKVVERATLELNDMIADDVKNIAAGS